MNKLILVIGVILGLSGCEKPKNAQDGSIENIQLPNAETAHETASSAYNWEDVPNAHTTEVTISTSAQHDHEEIIEALTRELKKDHFKLKPNTTTASNLSINDCKQNKIFIIKGEGSKSFWAERTKGIGEKKDYYPDFNMDVMSFETEQSAEQHLKTLEQAISSGNGFCNGKSPIKIIRHGTHLFYFGTRAEMFRGYINEFADFIQNYKSVE